MPLFTWNGQSAAPIRRDGNAEIVAILPEHDRVLFASVTAMDRSEMLDQNFRNGSPESIERAACEPPAKALPWLGTTRLLLAGDEGPIQCVGLDDPLITQYVSAYRGVRMLAGSDELVAACSPDRQRIIFWNSWDGPPAGGGIVLVTSLTRHRLTDLSFG